MAGDEWDIVTTGAIVITAAIGIDADRRDERRARADLTEGKKAWRSSQA